MRDSPLNTIHAYFPRHLELKMMSNEIKKGLIYNSMVTY